MIARLDNRKTKLTWEKVDEIRRLYQTTQLSQHKIGKQFGVSQRAICFIINGVHWRPENDPRCKA